MSRSLNLPLAGLTFLLGLAIGLAGMSAIRAGGDKTDAVSQEIKDLRRIVENLEGKLKKTVENNDQVAKLVAGMKQRAEESEVINQALYVRNELKLQGKEPQGNKLPEPITLSLPEANLGTRGQITKIDAADLTLVEVNLGKDAGLEKHNTLEVIRPGSPPEYIATLRVFEVYNQRAFCRLVSTNPLKKQTVKIGDHVSKSRE